MTDSILDPRPVASAHVHAPVTKTDAPDATASRSSPPPIVVGRTQGPMLFDKDKRLICVKQLPLPGVVIFVHGVNSEGEWYKASEEGLCKGLNRRLGRLDDQMKYHGVDAGQLTPAKYTESVTPEGFLNPKLLPNNYVKPDPSFSPVIHFRWGYRATLEELKEYGDKIFLNEKDYWGGGPFTNGCSSLPDLWHGGLDDRAVGWITVQGINPTNRPLYRAPPRAYGVLAALRLAKLIESIRKMRADVPITVVCHSQGNIVGLTGAFFGDALPEAEDPWGRKGRCVADAYVLANAPYSLANSEGPHRSDTFMDTWSQRATKDADGKRGRQTYAARTQTLRTFLSMIGDRADHEPSPDTVDADMANNRVSPTSDKSFAAQADRARHGLNGSTYGRVTAYCCPHDQVISAITVQGIGWRGIDRHELTDSDAASARLVGLSQTLTEILPEYDHKNQAFNTAALLGDMGTGSALTDVALAIGRTNHYGGNALVAGTTDPKHPAAVVVMPPANLTPIDPNEDWFRARGGNNAYLPWWGRRHDTNYGMQGYSW